MPSVVTAGVPSRNPLVYHGPLVSSGMTLRFKVMPAVRSAASACRPLSPNGRTIDEHEVVVRAAGHHL